MILVGEKTMGSVAYGKFAGSAAARAIDSMDDRSEPCVSRNGQQTSTPNIPSQLVRSVQAARRRRTALFDGDLFSDPAWDILLELYALHVEQRRASVSSVYDASSVPASTALRWLGKLENDGLVQRTEDPLDARRSWVELTADGRQRMHRFFEMLPLAMVTV